MTPPSAMTPRLLIVEPERELRMWLRHHVEILWPDAVPQDLDRAQFESRQASVTRKNIDLLLFGMNFGGGEAQDEFHALRRLLQQPGCPPVVVIATAGNELNAVRAIRLGAADYLPRNLLNAQRLGNSLRSALRRARRQSRSAAQRAIAQTDAHPISKALMAAARPKRPRTDDSTPALPQYTILHQLGTSSRATVYLAYSTALGRNVALKVSKPTAESSEERRHFAREYAAISALRHPAVVDIYDYGIHDGREFIAMEYFPCGDLKTRLRQPLTVAESLDYARRICAALQVVHAAGLLHRDLKPPNIMLREDGAIVLIDFGLAKQISSTTQSTAAGVLHGSPYYMSPEQAQGLPLDQRSDLYSVGVILFEMLTGQKPFLGETAVEVMHLHVHGKRPPLPPELVQYEPLMERFMAGAREQRFASADAALTALQTPEAVEPIDASAATVQARGLVHAL